MEEPSLRTWSSWKMTSKTYTVNLNATYQTLNHYTIAYLENIQAANMIENHY